MYQELENHWDRNEHGRLTLKAGFLTWLCVPLTADLTCRFEWMQGIGGTWLKLGVKLEHLVSDFPARWISVSLRAIDGQQWPSLVTLQNACGGFNSVGFNLCRPWSLRHQFLSRLISHSCPCGNTANSPEKGTPHFRRVSSEIRWWGGDVEQARGKFKSDLF